MEHPLIGNLDALTEEELTTKISELNRKLSIAAQNGNGHLCNQIRMVIESYQSKYQQRIREASERAGAMSHSDKIDIK